MYFWEHQERHFRCQVFSLIWCSLLMINFNLKSTSKEAQAIAGQWYFHWGKWYLHFVLLDKVIAEIDFRFFSKIMSIANVSRQVCWKTCRWLWWPTQPCIATPLYWQTRNDFLVLWDVNNWIHCSQEKHEDTVQRAVWPEQRFNKSIQNSLQQSHGAVE